MLFIEMVEPHSRMMGIILIMKLIKLLVENYKSVLNSTEFKTDQVTCLVGKNEAGKSALLEALYKLNPIVESDGNFTEEEYPRRFIVNSRERGDLGTTNVLSTYWELDPTDKTFLKTVIGVEVLTEEPITIRKGYSNTLHWTVPVDEQKVVSQLVENARFNASEKAQVKGITSVELLGYKLERLASKTRKQAELLANIRSTYANLSFSQYIAKHLYSRLPKFLYFRDYDKLPGKVATTDLANRRRNGRLTMGDNIFLALLDLTNTNLENIQTTGTSERFIMELEIVKNSLTDQLKRFWSQNRFLEVEFRYDAARPNDPPPFNDGAVFSTRILNTRHRATVNFDERSTGFIWFFSFLIWFSQIKKNYGENIFVLLDEPGLTLHGTAQKDLLNYINERLRPNHQVIFTTHSPFMIDNEHIFSLRTVEDVIERNSKTEEEDILGTKVGEEVLSKDRDTILPLQSKIGLDVANTLFLGPYVLVVEGPTEDAYIKWFSRELVKRGRSGLDIRWAVAPAESASKVSSFVSLFHNRGLSIAALLDYHEGQKGNVDRLAQSNLLKEGHLIKVTDIVGQDEADIEDLLGRDFYIGLINKQLTIYGAKKLPDERPEEASIRVVKEVETHFATLPPAVPEFSHYQPITALLNFPPEEIDSIVGLENALDRFEQLFQRLNALIT